MQVLVFVQFISVLDIDCSNLKADEIIV
jgi:SNF2 family DNA or RNA helicase